MKLISFYTGDDYYADHAAKLMEKCELYGVDYLIANFDPDGDWLAKTRTKPYFILSMLEQLDEDLLWLDVDCDLIDYPRVSGDKWGVIMKTYTMPHVYALYIPNTEQSRYYLKLWQEHLGELGDHDAFMEIFNLTDCVILPPNTFVLKESGNWEKTDVYRRLRDAAINGTPRRQDSISTPKGGQHAE